jgi:hypothetical protein
MIGTEHIAGDTLDFLDDVPTYPPADGWTLKYRLVPRFTSPVQAPIDITASTSGTQYRVQAAASVTAGWKAGAYSWARWVEKAGPIRQSLGEGQFKILPDPAAAAQGLDSRSHPRKMLEQIEAALEAFSIGVKSYAIGSRQMTKQDIPEILTMRDRYKAEVASEDAAAQMASGQGNPRTFGVRFRRV